MILENNFPRNNEGCGQNTQCQNKASPLKQEMLKNFFFTFLSSKPAILMAVRYHRLRMGIGGPRNQTRDLLEPKTLFLQKQIFFMLNIFHSTSSSFI